MKKRFLQFSTVLLLISVFMIFFASAGLASSEGADGRIITTIGGVPQAAQLVLTSYALEEGVDSTSHVLRITLANEGTADAYNILLTFDDKHLKLLPAYGTSNQVHVPRISAQSSVEHEIPLMSVGEVDSFLIAFSAEYFNPQYSFRQNFHIGSFTGKPVDLVQLLEIELTGIADEDGLVPVRMAVQNRTDTDLSDVVVHVYSLLDNATQSIELGTLAANATLNETYPILLNNNRIQQVRAYISYKGEAKDTSNTQESLFTLYRYETRYSASQSEMASYYMTEIVVHLSLIAVLVLLLLVLVLRRRHKGSAQAGSKFKETRDIPERVLVNIPEGEPEDAPEEEPEDSPEEELEDAPEEELEDTSEGEPEDSPEEEPEDAPEGEPEDSPEEEPEGIPEGELEDAPEGEPEDASEEEPEGIPEGNPEDTLEEITWEMLEEETWDMFDEETGDTHEE